MGHTEVGKSYLARKIAEFLILKSGKDLNLEEMRILWTNKEIESWLIMQKVTYERDPRTLFFFM